MGLELLIGAAIVTTAASAVYANEAADAQRDAARAQKKQADLRAARERTEQIRSARIASAQAQLAGETQGVAESSGVSGGVGSIISQLGSNLGFSIQMQRLSDQAAAELAQASKESGIASIFGSASNLFMAGASMAAGGGPTKPDEADGPKSSGTNTSNHDEADGPKSSGTNTSNHTAPIF